MVISALFFKKVKLKLKKIKKNKKFSDQQVKTKTVLYYSKPVACKRDIVLKSIINIRRCLIYEDQMKRVN